MIDLRPATQQRLAAQLDPIPERVPWEWCRDEVDFGLAPNYPTEYSGPYDPEFLPFWKECLENVFDPRIREQAIWKCSQAGGTENVALNAIRFAVGCAPRRILYVWGDMHAAEDDFKERIVGGLECGKVTHDRLRAAPRCVECRLEFDNMTVAGGWPKNKMVFKRNPWSLIIADEFSTYPGLTPGMIRRRCDTVPFSHILWLSSMDPQMKHASKRDPIYEEWLAGDQREWQVADPRTGRMFTMSMLGLKWEGKREDGTWDLKQVRESAYYETPDGTRIENADRMRLVRAGRWVPTNTDAPEWRRSYRVNTFLMPFKSGDFGSIAVAFLDAKAQGVAALKVFTYEHLAEVWEEGAERSDVVALRKRVGEYKQGQLLHEADIYRDIYVKKAHGVFVTADIQKETHWAVAREWIEGGDSGLLGYHHGMLIEDLRAFDTEHKASQVYVDNNYRRRSMEVYEACSRWQWMPTIGSDKLAIPFKRRTVDPFEGKQGQGNPETQMHEITFDTDVFKSLLTDLICGRAVQQWYVYEGIVREYVQQVISEEKIDGIWQKRRGHPDNHLFDCEVLQLLCATVEGFYRNEFLMVAEDEE